MSTKWDDLMMGVQCYELFNGIALKNHAFFYSSFWHCIKISFDLIMHYPLYDIVAFLVILLTWFLTIILYTFATLVSKYICQHFCFL